MKKLSLILFTLLMACNSKTEDKVSSKVEKEKFVFATWTNGGGEFNESKWEEKLTYYDSLGISQILVGANAQVLKKLVPLASKKNIKVHAWMWTLNRPGDTIAQKHPEWYAVNRAGKNSLEYRAYVNYYQWLSPFHPEARNHIKNNVKELATIKGLASIHLDYVRYVDVILGKDLHNKIRNDVINFYSILFYSFICLTILLLA